MKNTFESFELNVRHLSEPKDFEENKGLLRDVDLQVYEIVAYALRMGANIENAIKIAEEIFKITTITSLTQAEVISLLPRFSKINLFLERS